MIKIKKITSHFIANQRRNWIFRKIASFCKSYLKAFENWNNDHYTNGEFYVLDKFFHKSLTTIFDVGANVGNWSLAAAKFHEKATVYSFEPIPPVYKQLQANTQKLKQIHAVNTGLSNQNSQITFHYYPHGILFNSMFQHPRGGELVDVECIVQTGDYFCKEFKVENIDLLKIDVEGAEHLVLQGFINMLKDNKIKAIQFEYGTNNILTKFLLKDFYELLTPYNFKIGKIYPNYIDFKDYHISQENFIEGNFLAVNNEFFKP